MDKRTHAARFYQPIVAVKKFPAKGTEKEFTRVHVSFQSTSSCHFTTVNALNECKTGVEQRERGRGNNKRVRGRGGEGGGQKTV